MKRLSFMTPIVALLGLLGCTELDEVGCQTDEDCGNDYQCIEGICALPPTLVVNSPLNFGESPVGIRERGRLVLTNGGDVTLTISDFQIEPEDGVFYIAVQELPITLKGKQSRELPIYFRPLDIKNYEGELSFSSNHEGPKLIPVDLLGKGISNVVCLSCLPPPDPECYDEGSSSISYLPTSDNSCDSSLGVCAYRMVETLCEEICDETTGLCPNVPPPVSNWDAGVTPIEPTDAGSPSNTPLDAGSPPQPIVDAGPPPGACSETILEGDPCDDNDACTQNDTCENSLCLGTPLCTDVPENECIDEQNLRQYTSLAGCNNGTCLYESEDTFCAFGCSENHCLQPRQLSNLKITSGHHQATSAGKTIRAQITNAPISTMSAHERILRVRISTSEDSNASLP